MKRIIFTLFVFLFFAGTLLAQSPDAFQYQAVVRDSEGNLRANEDVTLDIAIIQGSANGSTVYRETHEPTTNGAGLVTLEVGSGSSGDSFSAIDWSDGPWFIEVSLDGTQMGTSQLLSVPFAKYADQAGNTFSGSFNDLEDVPVNLDTDSTDDAATNFSHLEGIPEHLDTDSTDDFSGVFSDLRGTPQHLDTDSTDDFSGDYNDLTSLPDLDLKLDTAATDGWDKDSTDDFSGDYDDLTDRPLYISDLKLVADGRSIRQVGEPDDPDDAATKNYVDNSITSSPMTPIAMGNISSDGSTSTGSGNFTSTWTANDRYRIAIEGYNFYAPNYVVVVTPYFSGNSVDSFQSSSVAGDLLLYFYDDAGNPIQADFNFVVYQPGE